MPVTIKIANFTSVNIKEKSALTSDIDAGTTALPVENNQNFAADDPVLIGGFGAETAEIRKVASTTGSNTVTTDATTQHHTRFDRVTVLYGDQIKVYSAPNTDGTQPADSAFVTLVDTVTIDPDDTTTVVTDSTGSSAVWYKFTYYNSVTNAQTALADSRSVRGGSVGNYCSLDSIRQEAGFGGNRNISDSLVEQFRRQAQSAVDGGLTGLYALPFTAPINPTIERITMLYGAGYLQIDQYGQTYNANDQGVNRKIAEADATIERIKSGQLELIGTDGQTTASADNGSVRGYPDRNTAGQGGGDYKFHMSDTDGYYGRAY